MFFPTFESWLFISISVFKMWCGWKAQSIGWTKVFAVLYFFYIQYSMYSTHIQYTQLLHCLCDPHCYTSFKLLLFSCGYSCIFSTFLTLLLAYMNESTICWMCEDTPIVTILEFQSKDWLCKRLGTVVSWSENLLKQWTKSESDQTGVWSFCQRWRIKAAKCEACTRPISQFDLALNLSGHLSFPSHCLYTCVSFYFEFGRNLFVWIQKICTVCYKILR